MPEISSSNRENDEVNIEDHHSDIDGNLDDSNSGSGDIAEKQHKKMQGNQVPFNKHISILFSEPLIELNKGHVRAFRAMGSHDYPPNMIAYIVDKHYSSRLMASIKYNRIKSPDFIKLQASGNIFYPIEKKECFCFLYEDVGVPLIDSNQSSHALGLEPDIVLQNVVQPVISALQSFYEKDIYHGEIWPGNMFSTGVGLNEKVKLGECLSSPVSYALPRLYEPVERAMSDDIGRGEGSITDDLYSFGVSLAVLLRSTDPMENLSNEEIIEQKIEKGSYTSLIGKDRFSGATLELLRGLLYDDPAQRWTLDDVSAWMDGRRLSPKQSTKRIKASRPIIFNGKKYTRPELLAKDLHLNVDEVVRCVENDDLFQWLERAIEDKTVKVGVEDAIKSIIYFKTNTDYPKHLSVVLAAALYRECPVRYKGLSFMPSSFGQMLSAAYMQSKELQPYLDILRHQFLIQAVKNNRQGADSPGLIAKLDSCRAFISQTMIGSGLERCLYFLDSNCPCLSTIVKNYYVTTAEELMEALETVCTTSKPKTLMDRHIVAFLSIKDKKNIDPYLPDLRSDKKHVQTLSVVKVFATIQARSKLSNFPAVAEWLSNNMNEIYDVIHDQETINELKKEVTKAKKTGNLSEIVYIFDKPSLYQNDQLSFARAMDEYQILETEKETLEEKLDNKNYGQRTGAQIAAVISMGISMLIILISAYSLLFVG